MRVWLRRYVRSRLLGTYPVASYSDEPATNETFVNNIQTILLEKETELPRGKQPVVECMEKLRKELRGEK